MFHCSPCSTSESIAQVQSPSAESANPCPTERAVSTVSASADANFLLVPPGSVSSDSLLLKPNPNSSQSLSPDAVLSDLLKRISDLESAHTNDIKA